MAARGQGEAAAALRIRMFGAFDAHLHGAPLRKLRTAKSRWLLALLALQDSSEVERDWVAGTLWPESSQEHAFGNLRRALTDLRDALGAEAIRIRSIGKLRLQFDVDGAFVDALAFDAAVASGDEQSLERAVAIYTGPLLQGCPEDWALPEREKREQAYLDALESLAARALKRGEPEVAAGRLRQTVRIDPLREGAQRALIDALAQSGAFAAATQAYRDFRILLHRELNTEPSPETAALFDTVRSRSRRAAAASPKRAGTPPAGGVTPPAPSRLPQPLSRLIGRGEMAAEVEADLSAGRLVTLTGTGGIGKTRLAIHVAEAVSDRFRDGACFVDLGPLSDSALVDQTVAAATGLAPPPVGLKAARGAGELRRPQLVDHLRDRQMLLLLDNCEHLLQPAAALAHELLRWCPDLRVLATSRRPLGVTGEIVHRVPPLPVPPVADATTASGRDKEAPAILLDYDAVRLFVERARMVNRAFRVTPRNACVVAEICRRLDGIPLALELAAAQAATYTVDTIRSGLDRRFETLVLGSMTAPPRQQTLEAALDWSYNGLAERSRAVFRGLGAFAGSFSREACASVCAGPGSPAPARDVRIALADLTDRSLAQMDEQSGEERYRVLETVRAFARLRLEQAGELAKTEERHAAWYVAQAEASAARMGWAEQAGALRRIEPDTANLRAAFSWTLEHDPHGALSLSAWLSTIWGYLGLFAEARSMLTAALEAAGESGEPALKALVFLELGHHAAFTSDYEAAQSWCAESARLFGLTGDRAHECNALRRQAMAILHTEGAAAAAPLVEQSLRVGRESGDEEEIAACLYGQAQVFTMRGDYGAAWSAASEAVTLARGLETRSHEATYANMLGLVAAIQGAYPLATELYEEGVRLFNERRDRPGTAVTVKNLAAVSASSGEYDRARALAEQAMPELDSMQLRSALSECLLIRAVCAGARRDALLATESLGRSADIAEACRDQQSLGCARVEQACFALDAGDTALARDRCSEGLQLLARAGRIDQIAAALEGIAAVKLAAGRPEQALADMGAAQCIRKRVGAPAPAWLRERNERCLAALGAALGPDVLESALAAGNALGVEEVVARALVDHGTALAGGSGT